MKPNVFCVGAGKCGTTRLYGLMRAHTQCCASDVKETMYFEHYFDRGVDWYEKHFRVDRAHLAIGEVSNTYIFNPEIAARIKSYNPDAKIVVTVRNPIERALSHYLYLKRGGLQLPPFEQAIRDPQHEHILWRGCYFKHMQPYLACFPPEQVQVLVFEDLIADKERYARQFLDFIGVDSAVPDFDENQYRLRAGKARSPRLARLLKKGANLARDLDLGPLVQKVKNSAVPKLAYRNIAASEKPVIDNALRGRLAEYFRADTAALSEWTGRDLEHEWLQQ